jgi:hypothetical protein
METENTNNEKINSIKNISNIKTIKNIKKNKSLKTPHNFNSKEFSFGSHFNSSTDDYSSLKHTKTNSKKIDLIFNSFNKKKRNNSSLKYYNYNSDFKTKNSLISINKKNKSVKFIDDAFHQPLTEVILIQSYKKYNASNNYNGNDLDDKDENKNICCIII